jgi:predicted transcriptional regulator
MSAWGLFRSLSSKSRLAVIDALRENPLRYSEIMDKTGLSTTDISRQLNRLSSDLLVEKNPSDQYQLTQYGKITATSVPLIQFLVENKEFFNTRDLSGIPKELIENIASLRNGTMVDSVYESIKLQQEIIPTISEHFSMITDDLGPIWVDTTQKLVDDGVVVKAIFTPELAKKVLAEAPSKLVAGMQIRTMTPLKLVLGYSDKHALLCFSSLDGKPDRNHYLFGYDIMFKHWAFHCFNHFWRRASPI